MNPQQLLARLKSLTSALTSAQLTSLVVAFVGVVGLMVGSTYWLNRVDYSLLFADLDAEAAADVVTKLRAQKVTFQLDDGGRAIRVPADKVDELRLQFSGDGLPSSGRIGFEIFDRTAFGQTQFLEQVNYRRALEGELARTIATIAEVGSARVHISMAKESLFSTRAEPAKASVVLKLRGSRPLAASTIQAVGSLVAAGVEGLRPEAVVIIDSFGRPLSRPSGDDDTPLGGAQLEKQQRVERDLGARVVALLEPIVGMDRVRVNVSARLDPSSEERTEEHWDPATVVRSRQTTTDGAIESAAGQTGLAGARANMPGPVTPANPTGATVPDAVAGGEPPKVLTRGSETINYEISKIVSHTIRPRGDIARLSVAVILDHESSMAKGSDGQPHRTTKPRDPAQVAKIQGLVAAAVGLDTVRGDQLTVESIAFDEPEVEVLDVPKVWEKYLPQAMEGARILVVALFGLLALLFVVRPVVRRAIAASPSALELPQMPQLPRTVKDLEGEMDAQLDAGSGPGGRRSIPILAKRLTAMTEKEPESAARLLRTWLTEGQ